jgi:hypothetical protein
MTTETAFTQIEKATSPKTLFSGSDDPKKRYKTWARVVHPDVNPDQRDRAAEAFAKLVDFWTKFNLVQSNIYTFKTKKSEYQATGPVFSDATCDVYEVLGVDERFIRVPRAPRTDDLMGRETTALKRFAGPHDGWDFPVAFTGKLLETARSSDGRRFHVVEYPQDLRTLHELKTLLPAGVKIPDLAWMMRRILTGLSAAHKDGIVHGAPVPSNIAIQAEMHGVVLTNWTSSTSLGGGERVLAVDPRYKRLIAPEILKKEPPTPASDIYTAARTFKLLAGDYLTPRFSAFVRGCTFEKADLRPQSAYELRNEFDELLERAYGPRKFRPFNWPDE